jgi:hypothetical protein
MPRTSGCRQVSVSPSIASRSGCIRARVAGGCSATLSQAAVAAPTTNDAASAATAIGAVNNCTRSTCKPRPEERSRSHTRLVVRVRLDQAVPAGQRREEGRLRDFIESRRDAGNETDCVDLSHGEQVSSGSNRDRCEDGRARDLRDHHHRSPPGSVQQQTSRETEQQAGGELDRAEQAQLGWCRPKRNGRDDWQGEPCELGPEQRYRLPTPKLQELGVAQQTPPTIDHRFPPMVAAPMVWPRSHRDLPARAAPQNQEAGPRVPGVYHVADGQSRPRSQPRALGVGSALVAAARKPMSDGIRYSWFRLHYVEMRGWHRTADNAALRGDAEAVLLTTISALAEALRAAMVLDREPYPYPKWLPSRAASCPTGSRLVAARAQFLALLEAGGMRAHDLDRPGTLGEPLREMRAILIERARDTGIDGDWLERWWLAIDEARTGVGEHRWPDTGQ